MNLESSGVVELGTSSVWETGRSLTRGDSAAAAYHTVDTSVVPDVLGLRACYEDAKLTRVLSGRAQNSV